MQEPGFLEYIGDKVIVIGHHNADPDAVGAAQGVKELIEVLKKDVSVRIVMPDDISKLSGKIIKTLMLEVSEDYIGTFDTVVIVDSGSLNQLGSWKPVIQNGENVVVMIDHHTLDEDIQKYVDLLIHSEDASSTSEIVHSLYKKYNHTPTTKTAKALLAGIAFDTMFFSIGSSKTYNAVSDLLSSVNDVSEVLTMFRTERTFSERIARLKTATRAEIHRISGYVVAFSEVGSYQASGARGLVGLGADLAVVVGDEKDSLRASMRSAQGFFDDTGFHLGELVAGFTEEYGGSGSGHPTAAGYNGVGEYRVFVDNFLAILRDLIA